MKADYTYLKNNAFGGFVFDKIYQNKTAMENDIKNVLIGRYVFVIGESNENEVYQRVWRKDGALYEFITSLSPLSKEEETALKEQFEKEIDDFATTGKNAIADFNQNGLTAINNFNDKATEALQAFKWKIH